MPNDVILVHCDYCCYYHCDDAYVLSAMLPACRRTSSAAAATKKKSRAERLRAPQSAEQINLRGSDTTRCQSLYSLLAPKIIALRSFNLIYLRSESSHNFFLPLSLRRSFVSLIISSVCVGAAAERTGSRARRSVFPFFLIELICFLSRSLLRCKSIAGRTEHFPPLTT